MAKQMEQLMSVSLSDKGEIVFPAKLRKLLKLKTGTKFFIWHYNDEVILKKIHPAVPRADLGDIVQEEQKKAKKIGITKKAVKAAILQVRKHENDPRYYKGESLSSLIKKTRKEAKKAGVTKAAVKAVLAKARKQP